MADDTSTTSTDTTTDATAATAADSTTTSGTGTTDQPEIPAEVKRALNKANREAETLRLKLKEFEDRDKTDQQKLTERLTAAEAAAAASGLELARFRVAAKAGIPADLAGRLQGSNEEELTADAASLKTLLGDATSATSFDGGARTPAGAPRDMNDLIRRSMPGR